MVTLKITEDKTTYSKNKDFKITEQHTSYYRTPDGVPKNRVMKTKKTKFK